MPEPRPDLIGESKSLLSRVELLQVEVIQRAFDSKLGNRALRWLQRNVGAQWIQLATSRLTHFHHLDRFGRLAPNDSCILVCNHRSFFDLYIVVTHLVRNGLTQRITFPVRSEFFYDHPLGLPINGAVSGFAMYPPIFRERQRAHLNLLGLDELAWLLRSGGTLVGFHPEGTRNRGNPYELLPARTGIGRLIHQSRVMVLPVFTNGLLPENLKQQIRGNFDGSGIPIHTVFGKPIEFGGLLDEPATQGTFKRIANLTRDAIMALGREEAELRRAAGHAFSEGSIPP
ncbi:MAG TPA: lysophospholipid acyltransferase family protein [Polyangiaceae bacterium]|jgi:1-acyl-sn-glycerol-3-phosphate acyltransferase|nr:lysophospholipid acyltransferase family protein [Polyangiaceae bacterium]